MKNKFDSVSLLGDDSLVMTWDLGKRCNYDCSYCPSHRHDNFSPHTSLETLKKNVNSFFRYFKLVCKYKKNKLVAINFTGGEPTVHPNIIEFMEFLRNHHTENYSSDFAMNLAMTTNGAMSEKIANCVIDTCSHVTVSYHTEAAQILKDQCIKRIFQFHEAVKNKKITLMINVMFHAENFEECVKLCERLDEHKIVYVPRVIGEEKNSASSFSHRYTKEQLEWMKSKWK